MRIGLRAVPFEVDGDSAVDSSDPNLTCEWDCPLIEQDRDSVTTGGYGMAQSDLDRHLKESDACPGPRFDRIAGGWVVKCSLR